MFHSSFCFPSLCFALQFFNWFHIQLTTTALICPLNLREYLKKYPCVSDTTDAFDMSLFTVQCILNFNAMKKYCIAIFRNCGTTSGNDNYGGWLQVTINYFAAYIRNLTLTWQGHHSPSIASIGGSDSFYHVLWLKDICQIGIQLQSSQSFHLGDPLANRSLLQCLCTTCE